MNIPEKYRKAFTARHMLMLFADIMDMAITENLPNAGVMKGTIKNRSNRIKQDAEQICKDLSKQIMVQNEESIMGSKNFAYAFYTIIAAIRNWDMDDLYNLAEELKERKK